MSVSISSSLPECVMASGKMHLLNLLTSILNYTSLLLCMQAGFRIWKRADRLRAFLRDDPYERPAKIFGCVTGRGFRQRCAIKAGQIGKNEADRANSDFTAVAACRMMA
jgi:hypothetical protein